LTDSKVQRPRSRVQRRTSVARGAPLL
jgi:hypothetical protein